MNTSKIIRGIVNSRGYTITSAITQWDYGYVFVPEFEDMPATYRLDFSNDEHHGTALPVYCGSEGGEVPEELIDTGKDIYVWFFYIGDGFGKSEYKWRIPNHCKPQTEQDEPTPSQQSAIDQAISVVNDAVEQAQEAQQAIEDMSVSAQTLAEGSSATVTKTEQDGVVHLAFGIPKGATGDTPTITASKTGKTTSIYVDGSEVAQIEDGTDGTDGISPSISVTDITGGHRVVITDKDGTESFDVEDGATGATPNLTIGTVETLEPTDDATATITGTPENPVLNLGIPQGEQGEVTLADLNAALMDKADVITDTASGSIASFTDGADNLPLKSLVVDINPVQDLHGYDSPWPAGGGTNLLPFEDVFENGWTTTLNGLTATYNNGFMHVTGTNESSTWTNLVFYSGVWVRNPLEFGAGNYTMSNKLTIVCKIDDAAAYVNKSIAFTAESVLNVKGFYVAVQGGLTVDYNIPLMFIRGTTMPTSYSPYENICPISGWTEVDVNHSDADMTNPTTVTIELGQTVYGAKLYPLEGKALITMAMADLGALDWSSYAIASNCFKAILSDGKATKTNYSADGQCSTYAKADYVTTLRDTDSTFGIGYSNLSNVDCYVVVHDSHFTDATAFKTAMSGVQLCYELAEPIEIQLSPNQINSLLGANNIWADSGDTEAVYRADTKLYIQKKIAEAISALS